MNTEDLSGPLSATEVSLKEAATLDGSEYAEYPLSRLPYHWIKQSEDNSQTHLQLAHIRSALVVDVFNVILPKNKLFISEISYPNSLVTWKVPHKKEGKNITLTSNKKVVNIDEPTILIGGHNNHYHWILNWLPRIISWKKLSLKLMGIPHELKFAVHHGITQSHLDLLINQGVDKNSIIIMRPDVYRYYVRDAYIPNFFSSHCYYREVMDLYFEMKQTFSPGPDWAIYITRNGLGEPRRRVINESDLDLVLLKYGVKKVLLENLTVQEQIALFRGADAIIGAHGAGIANIVFAKRGADLLLFEDKNVSEFVELAMLCDVRCHISRPIQHVNTDYETKNPSFQTRNRDIIVDINRVEDFLKDVKQRKKSSRFI